MLHKADKFPVLNIKEAEGIVHELGRALDTHREWSGKFRSMLVCRTKPKSSDLDDNSHKKTVFGKWYFGDVNPLLLNHPGFKTVGKNSENMHDAARRLAQTVLDGDDVKLAQYNAFVKSVDCFRISIRKLLSEAWESLRYTDPLTGVTTRTTMKPRLEDEQDRSRRNGTPCSLGLMDLDHFKNVNDTYGHQAGDRVLKDISAYMLKHLRRYDQVFRYGGEEFLLLLPNSTTKNAKDVLDRLRCGIKRQSINVGDGKKIHVSASFGVAEMHPSNQINDAIERADQALYAAKSAGRNRVHIW